MTIRYSKFLNIHTHQDEITSDCIAIINKSDGYYPIGKGKNYSVGIHPWFIDALNFENQQQELLAIIHHPYVWAIGECGLDNGCDTDFELQLKAFTLQVRLANAVSKPLIIHCVRSYDEILLLLRKEKNRVPVIFHGFNKSYELASQLLHSGYYLSFGKHLEKESVREVFRKIPDDRVFLETDDSGLPVSLIYEQAAAAKGLRIEALCMQVLHNAEHVFNRRFD